MENSKIEWTDHTFNPWIGCTKVSPACDNCYAERLMDTRLGAVEWGGPRKRTSPANWRKPLAWNNAAEAAGVRARVFCASLADVFDNAIDPLWRTDLWELIRDTPHLDWLLLTKRISNAQTMIARDLKNVWVGATIVNQDEADRDHAKLLRAPAAVRFLSCEPLLGPIEFDKECLQGTDWVIVGGESGPHARPMSEHWALSIAEQCRDAGVAFFMKQGSQANWPHWKSMSRWHERLQVREFPAIRRTI